MPRRWTARALVASLGGTLDKNAVADFRASIDGQGDAPDNYTTGLSWTDGAGQQHDWSATNDAPRGQQPANIAAEMARLTLAAVAAAEGVPPIFRSIVGGIGLATADAAKMTDAMGRIKGADALMNFADGLTGADNPLRTLFPKIFKEAAALSLDGLWQDAHVANSTKNADGTLSAAGAAAAADAATAYQSLNGATRDYIMTLDLAEMSTTEMAAAQGRLSALDAVADQFDAMGMGAGTLTTAFVAAIGGLGGLEGGMANLSTLQQNMAGYYAAAYTPAEQLASAQANLNTSFGELGLAVPTSVAGFRQIVDGLDLTTESGAQMYATLMALFPAFNKVTQSAAATRAQLLQDAQEKNAANTSFAQNQLRLSGGSEIDIAQLGVDQQVANVNDWLTANLYPAGKTLQDLLSLTAEEFSWLPKDLQALVLAAQQSAIGLDGLADSSAKAAAANARAFGRFSVLATNPEGLGAFDARAAQDDRNAALIDAAGKMAKAGISVADAAQMSRSTFESLNKTSQEIVLNYKEASAAIAADVTRIREAALGIANPEGHTLLNTGEYSNNTMSGAALARYDAQYSAAIEALTKGGKTSLEAQRSALQTLIEARDKEAALVGTPDEGWVGNDRHEIWRDAIQVLIDRAAPGINQLSAYESQYKGKGQQLLDLDKWETAQIANASGNASILAEIEQSYKNQFAKIVAAADATLKPLSDLLHSTLSGMRAATTSPQMQRAEAQAQIDAALAIAKAGGVLPAADKIKDALAIVGKQVSEGYASLFEQQRDYARSMASVSSLSEITDNQLSVADRSLLVQQDTLAVLRAMRASGQSIGEAQASSSEVVSVDAAPVETVYSVSALRISPAGDSGDLLSELRALKSEMSGRRDDAKQQSIEARDLRVQAAEIQQRLYRLVEKWDALGVEL